MQGTTHCNAKTARAIVNKIQNQKNRRKAKWKLKFHHQALPPEYLDHYEASIQSAKDKIQETSSSNITTLSPLSPSINNNSIFSIPIPALPNTTSFSSHPTIESHYNPNFQFNSQSTVRYGDLPYMGEMTLDNARPRRGRKPKKADICHLIYKNYGTTILDEPLNLCVRDLNNQIGINDNTNKNNNNVDSSNKNNRKKNSKNSNNQVTMCKFQFTGGAIPTLKEKKMLSVDSVNDFKFINSNYQQNESIDNFSSSNDSNWININDNNNNCLNLNMKPSSNSSMREQKRKTRKSLAREKLEKTFKEKGFLIQTQQLESAQGATYCKFRQLRKFTRYLFRSWKNHLPGDIVNNNAIA